MELILKSMEWWPNWVSGSLLGLCLLYWVIALIVAPLDFLDFGTDLDANTDIGDSSFLGGLLAPFLKLLNIGDVPVVVWLTPKALTWFVTGVVGYPKVQNEPAWAQWALLWGGLVLGLIVAKLVTEPLKPIFAHTGEFSAEDGNNQLIGQTVRVISGQITHDTPGQVEFSGDGPPQRLTARSTDPNTVFIRGQKAQIASRLPDQSVLLTTTS